MKVLLLYSILVCGYLTTLLYTVGADDSRETLPRITEGSTKTQSLRSSPNKCLSFEKHPQHSLYGFNNHIVNDVYLDDCKILCIRQTMFLCLSFEYNEHSGTCFLSADDMYTQPRAYGLNANTDYYQRYCGNENVPGTSTSTFVPSPTHKSTTENIPSSTVTTSSSTTTIPSTRLSTTPPTNTTTTPELSSTTVPRSTSTVPPQTSTSRWTTPEGENTTIFPEFYGVSFMELVKPNHIHRMCEVTIEFTTSSENGLLLYIGTAPDFLSLTMLNGHLEFRYNTGSGLAILRSQEPLALNKTHIVLASRLNRQGKLQVNDLEEVTGQSPEGSEVLNVMDSVFVGFVPPELYDTVVDQTENLSGMTGCIQSLTIEGMGSRLKYDLEFSTSEDVIQIESVGVCGGVLVEVSACDLHPCHHGNCLPKQPDTYECVCETGYTGENCESLLIIDVLDHVQVDRNLSSMAWINCIGRSTLENSDWTIRWYQNQSEVPASLADAAESSFVQTEYETDLLGAEKLFVAQLYFPHITEENSLTLNANYTCQLEIDNNPEPLMRKTIEISF